MVGKKGPTITKAPSKAATPSGQHNLFHFYQKQPRTRDSDKAVVASSVGGPLRLLPEDDMLNSSSIHQKQPQVTETDGVPRPEEVHSDKEPAKPSDDRFTLHPAQLSQEPSAVVDDKPTSEVSKPEQSRPFRKSQRKFYAIFEKSSTTSGSSQHATDDHRPAGTFEMVPDIIKNDDQVNLPNMIDLREPQSHSSVIQSAHQQHSIITLADDEQPSMRTQSPGSRDDPIDLRLSSPMESRPAKTLHPFFTRDINPKPKDIDVDASHLICSAPGCMDVLWPSAENQHKRGPQARFQASASSWFGPYHKIPRHLGVPTLPDHCFSAPPQLLESRADTAEPLSPPTPIVREAVWSSLPDDHRRHPGISRLLSERPEVDEGEVWSQKWRPRRAVEVLGNEKNALYLKSWLQALTIYPDNRLQTEVTDTKGKRALRDNSRGTKRLTVIRAVNKRGRKRRRQESDDGSSLDEWIVGDEEVPESSTSSGDGDSVLNWSSTRVAGTETSRSTHARHVGVGENASFSWSRSPHSAFSTLTNTILLTGPQGSGKTSTVYACAEELGWEIFEVYPGVGKRSGGNISSLIGDVGKNHLVRGRGTGTTRSERSRDQPGLGYLAESAAATYPEDEKWAIRQSAILLDEVDVLFKEDANFWPTVVNIIKSSHRPVFMTCNDISLIPRDDLPLQACLYFEPCPSPLAVSFLQCVSLVEGHIVPRRQLEIMYAKTYALMSCDEPDEPYVPYPSQRPPCSDLRRTLNNLQFWCSRIEPVTLDSKCMEGDEVPTLAEESEIAPGVMTGLWTEDLVDWTRVPDNFCGCSSEERSLQKFDLYRIAKHADCASYVDGYLGRRARDVLEALSIDRFRPSCDDEVGYALLDKPILGERSCGMAFYNRDADIAREALVASRHVLEMSGAGARVRGSLCGVTTRHRSLVLARMAKQALAASFLDDVITLSEPLLPRPPAATEYTPCVRQMILADDVLEAEAEAKGESSRRRRRWRMGDYVRHINVSNAGLDAARSTRLD